VDEWRTGCALFCKLLKNESKNSRSGKAERAPFAMCGMWPGRSTDSFQLLFNTKSKLINVLDWASWRSI
jgi:hypothetical protein